MAPLPRPRGHEMDPLLIKEASTLSSSTSRYHQYTNNNAKMTSSSSSSSLAAMKQRRQQQREKCCRTVVPTIMALVACCSVVGLISWKIHNPRLSSSSSSDSSISTSSTSSLSSKLSSLLDHTSRSYTNPHNPYGYVEIDEMDGNIIVHYSQDISAGSMSSSADGDHHIGNDDDDGLDSDGDKDSNVVSTDTNSTVSSTMIRQNDTVNNVKTNTNDNVHVNVNRTFGELAKILLPPWHMASVVAVQIDLLEDTKPNNTTLKFARQKLKIGRDLLDVFSPCYPPRSLWKKVRRLYADGYELVGYYKDLSASKMVYDEVLWTQRRNDVLQWKQRFLKLQRKHNILKFLVDINTNGGGASDSVGGYDHKQSHLFWGDLDTTTLPSATDDATTSFGKLLQVQLQNSLDYYDIIMNYDTVLLTSQQEDYHNFRKELRDVVDEFHLLGTSLLLPTPSSSSSSQSNNVNDVAPEDCIQTFGIAVKKIGIFHDQWTAYDKYTTDNTHHSKQVELADSINKKWTKFKKWTIKVDLRGQIVTLLDQLNQ